MGGQDFPLEAYLLDSGLAMKRALRDQALEGRGFNRHRLLEQAVEQLPAVARQSSVESEREFVQVLAEMLPGDSSFMDAKQPAFHQGRHTMHTGQEGGSGLAALADDAGPMDVAQSLQAGVGGPPIGDDDRSQCHGLLDEALQALGRGVGDWPHSDAANPSPSDFRGQGHQGFGPHVAFAAALLPPR